MTTTSLWLPSRLPPNLRRLGLGGWAWRGILQPEIRRGPPTTCGFPIPPGRAGRDIPPPGSPPS
eukprot:3071383-Alexandrium_andersonii.AAC.1